MGSDVPSVDDLVEGLAIGVGAGLAQSAVSKPREDSTVETVGVLAECQHCGFSFVMPENPEHWYTHCPECGERLLPATGGDVHPYREQGPAEPRDNGRD